jgi:hypothetical protein
MSRAARFREQFMPWAGLVVGLAAAGIAHQFGSEGVFNDCAVNSPVPLLIVALLCIAATAAAGLASWRIAANRSEGPTRRLVGLVSGGTAALFVFAMLLPMIASLLLPRCFQ